MSLSRPPSDRCPELADPSQWLVLLESKSPIHGPEPLMSSGVVVSPDPRLLGIHVQFLPGFLYQMRREKGVSKMKKQRERQAELGKGINGAEVRAESAGAPFRVLSA